MQRIVLISGATSFVMAFLGGLLAIGLVGPAAATAQASQVQEVHASAFVLVAPDGTVVGRLEPGTRGGGALTLFDAEGQRRTSLNGSGGMSAFDTDGTTLRFRAGYQLEAAPGGTPPVNGVLLAPDGSVSTLP
jgi:hypothetical protein